MPQSKKEHAEYMCNWRKSKRDEIEKQLLERTKNISQQQRKRELTILSDSCGSEPQATLKPQYPKTKSSLGANARGSSDSSEEPKPKSNQDRLRDILGEHAEWQKLKVKMFLF